MTDSGVTQLDDPGRGAELSDILRRKPALRRLYQEVYAKYHACLERCPREGIALELGSGGGFVQEVIPEMVTSDVLEYETVDQVVDAMNMPFADDSLRMICMLNVLHHIPDVEAFFREADRCLLPGGRIFIADQYPGWISTWILQHAHHEPFRPEASEWKFESTGPLSGANGALAWIVFQRDLEKFHQRFPRLRMTDFQPHTPLRYWLSGGLKTWSLLPDWAFLIATLGDRFLLACSPRWGSFLDVEIVKTE